MNEQEIRAIVRSAIAKHENPAERKSTGLDFRDASHHVYVLRRVDDDENGPCLIEPSVPCTHCNYCKSHGY